MKSAHELILESSFIPVSAAQRVALVAEFLREEYEDEYGVKHKCVPLITREQALELLGLEKTK